MALPSPKPGLVIHYEYLWRHEHEAGRDEGIKRRPCAIVLALVEANGRTSVVVAPMTHAAPQPPSVGTSAWMNSRHGWS